MDLVQKNQRNVTMDVMKGLGLLAIVIGHAEGPLSHYIYLYHMPMFFFISGYFYNDKYSQSIKSIMTLIKKRVKSLYKPYLIYSLIFLILHNIFFKLHIYSTEFTYGDKLIHPYSVAEFFKTLIQVVLFASREPMGGVFWFFTVLFLLNITFGVLSFVSIKLKKFNTEYTRLTFVLALFIVGNILTHFGFTIPRFNNTLVMVLVFYLGFLYKRYESKINISSLYFAVLCLTGLIFNSFYGSIAVNENSYLSPDFLLINTLFGVYFNLYLSKMIVEKSMQLKEALKYLGERTIIIVSLHFLSFKLVDLLQVIIYHINIEKLAKFPMINSGNGWWILYSLVGVLAPILLKRYVIDNIKKLIGKNNNSGTIHNNVA